MSIERKEGDLEPSTPVRYLKGVGPARAEAFERLGVRTVSELLEYFPRDWVFAPKAEKISRIEPKQEATIAGLVESTDYQQFRKPPIFEAIVSDDTGVCRIVWFNGGYLRGRIEPGQMITASGKVDIYKHQIQMTNPVFAIADGGRPQAEEYFSGGVYPASAELSSRQIKRIIAPLLERIDEFKPELFDEKFLEGAKLIDRKSAYKWIHNPPNEEKLEQARQRLKYDELFLMQVGLALRRYRSKHYAGATVCECTEKIDRRIRKRFPFLLTEDQDKAIVEIRADMARKEPMNRLLQGDVGSGKTVVALYAALVAVANGQQAAIMAPTEILAEQHFVSIERYLKASRVRRALITGGLAGVKRAQLMSRIKKGQVDIVVGTVALLEKDVEFKALGLVIIDEQHKFGVHQRAQMRKQAEPHCLVMTATPIPRTLAMTAFGDLDVSVIRHLPPGRGSVVTRWVEPENRLKAYKFIEDKLKARKQAYFVCPRISEAEGGVSAATKEHERLATEIFPQLRVGLLHGQMNAVKKRQVMSEFRKGKIDVLVSTVLVEVGVDVPNATIMVIEGAERFGLAQLHQLRGRIGRGQDKSYCLLFARTENDAAISRLGIMTRSNDGFEIAEEDLRLRGPGELFSTRQHGLPDLKIANILDDYELLVAARKSAFELVERDIMLAEPRHKNIRQSLLAKFGDSLGLADVA